TQAGAVGSECFDGFVLLSKAEAQEILRQGRDAPQQRKSGCSAVGRTVQDHAAGRCDLHRRAARGGQRG
ncbi:hypothetical protein, partial [Butyricicoccus sp.]|uniref:hypothetical protein n=1 Tax=Butyricicoccus sp. TaxID=2049021 RepID=UPI003AB0BE62